jgi:hypothetical protein
MDPVARLLQGAIDLHVHSSPSLVPRSADSWQVLRQAAAAGMRGVMIKDHHVTTAPQAYIVNRHADVQGCTLFSALCLNNAVGGLNPYAVEAAVRLGVDMVYLPTFSAQNHQDYMQRIPINEKPATAGRQGPPALQVRPIRLLDRRGRLKPAVRKIVDMVAAAGIVLGTGHCSIEEMVATVSYAVSRGCTKICLTHLPAFTTNNLQELKKVTDIGTSYIELVYEMILRDMPDPFRYTPVQLAEFIRFFGVERIIFSTDLGQANNPLPVEGMKAAIRMLIDQGFDEKEIRQMISVNPARLLGLV